MRRFLEWLLEFLRWLFGPQVTPATFSGDALALANKALDYWVNVHGSESLNQQCQRYSGYYTQWAYQGNESNITGYSSAQLAGNASPMTGAGINAAEVGDFIYWDVGSNDHVANVVGHDYSGGGKRTLVATATTHGDTVKQLRNGVKISHADTYPQGPFRGVSHKNGVNPDMVGITAWDIGSATPPAPNERVANSSGANARPDPSTAQPEIVAAGVAKNTKAAFDGWKTGEVVSGNPNWFTRLLSGVRYYYWSGGFTDTGTHDLADMNPKAPGVRTVAPSSAANVRSSPTTAAPVVGSYPAGSDQTFTHWTTGESVQGIDLWYATDAPVWAWAGGFTTQDKADLTELPFTSEWPADDYEFDAAGSFVDRVVGADWSNFENEWSVPDPGERKGFPDQPTSVVIHQWGNPGDYTIGSVINTFTHRHEDTGQVSAHFVIDGNEIVQMVSLDDRAWHAGSGGNDWVGIEADPYMTPEVIENIRLVLVYLRDRNGGVALTNVLHRDVPGTATSCGEWIAPHLDELDVSIPPDPPDPPDTDHPPISDEDVQRIAQATAALMRSQTDEVLAAIEPIPTTFTLTTD